MSLTTPAFWKPSTPLASCAPLSWQLIACVPHGYLLFLLSAHRGLSTGIFLGSSLLLCIFTPYTGSCLLWLQASVSSLIMLLGSQGTLATSSGHLSTGARLLGHVRFHPYGQPHFSHPISASVLVSQSCQTLCDPLDYSSWLPCPWNSPGKNTGVGCHSLLQGIFPTQELILQCRQILYHVSHQRSLVSTHAFAIFPSSQIRKLRVIIVSSLMYQFWNVPWLQFFPIHSWAQNHPDPALIPGFLPRSPRFHLPPTLNSETGLTFTKQHIY